ncbi:MAG: hypothetical protein HFG62_06705 [Lachnospiraceae bacterium]|nr:hypothetical protein [Lachnospiraceae bacterium]
MELEEGLELIQRICQTASRFAPDYDFDQVYGAWSSSVAVLAPGPAL